MRMFLRWEFPNGCFGDPALYISELNSHHAILIDCGDLTRFSPRQLLKISNIFLSHCHIDHFFGFDQFLRLHVGTDKQVTIFGPPNTSERVAGKLQGYTWNLVWDRNLEFVAVDLDTEKGTKRSVHFHAKNGFRPMSESTNCFDPSFPILDTGTFKVSTCTLDHRTPSLAYAIEENVSVSVNSAKLREMGFKTGPWLNKLKTKYLNDEIEDSIETLTDSSQKVFKVGDLSRWLLLPGQRHKLAYATDGAANELNFVTLLPFVNGADIFFAETCFLEKDRERADETKHFTAKFISELAERADVKRLFPFHFSKRYLDCPDEVYDEIRENFRADVIRDSEHQHRFEPSLRHG